MQAHDLHVVSMWLRLLTHDWFYRGIHGTNENPPMTKGRQVCYNYPVHVETIIPFSWDADQVDQVVPVTWLKDLRYFIVGVSAAPHGWLHMEVLERDKMEWMTDVPLHPQPSEVGG